MKALYVILGFIAVALGSIGAFLPILPTVPFLLLAAYFFSKGSPRFEAWFQSTKLYQQHLASYMEHRSMTMSKRIYVLSIATISMIIGLISIPVWPMRVFLVVMIIFMHIYFVKYVNTITVEEEQLLNAGYSLAEIEEYGVEALFAWSEQVSDEETEGESDICESETLMLESDEASVVAAESSEASLEAGDIDSPALDSCDTPPDTPPM